MSFQVLDPGFQSLLVDYGRLTSRSLGVPNGGAADRLSLALGNALVGNRPDAVALEITLTGPSLRADAETAGLVFGAPFDLHSDRQPLSAGKTFTLKAGELLRIGGTPRGLRAYLCVPGGFESPLILNSRSALEPLRAGETLVCPASRLPARSLGTNAPSSLPSSDCAILRILPGIQAGWFNLDQFIAQTFQITPASDRMGLRLRGEPLARPDREIVSEPVCPGSVQVTNDGQCIILGVDGQTIGGYPKIAQVIRADLDRLGQFRPGDQIRFSPVSLDEAEALALRQVAELHGWLARLAAVAD